MKKISETVVEEGTLDLPVDRYRTTVRAIILKDNKILMVYSKLFKDYTFPGGGVKAEESINEALIREVQEELGANKVKILDLYGYMEEKKFGMSENNRVYLQTSYYYFVEIDNIGKQNLMDNELEHGVDPVWLTINEAIENNSKIMTEFHHKKGMRTVLKREHEVLTSLLKGI